MNVNKCSSCGSRLGEGSVVFPCPSCGAEMIGRCARCKKLSIKYACKKCSFSGP